MNISSHFIGVCIDDKYVSAMITELGAYIREHSLVDAIVVQDIRSLHITLYYLDASLKSGDLEDIKADCYNLTAHGYGIAEAPFVVKYFGEAGGERVCYLRPNNVDMLTKCNEILASKYRFDKIAENMLAFVPHITLFRIVDPKRFASHKIKLEMIIDQYLGYLSASNCAGKIQLYAVDSSVSPELQIPID